MAPGAPACCWTGVKNQEHEKLHANVLDLLRQMTDTSDSNRIRGNVMALKTRRKSTRKAPGSAPARETLARAAVVQTGGVAIGTLRTSLGLTRKDFSRATGYSERAIADWEGGKPFSEASRKTMLEMTRIGDALARVIKAEFIGAWLKQPNEAFDGFKPIELIERGEVDRLWRMVFELESGAPN
ncbi:MAG: hypothetical protein KF774_02480 [Planctomyces sp.]|nr:hypothetical protein [Planctomyces sp.]